LTTLDTTVMDAHRTSQGYLTVSELLALPAVTLDPCSTLVSPHVEIGPGTVLYPGVVISCDERSRCVIGADNVLWPGTVIIAAGGGVIEIGSGNQLGPGGVQVKANMADARIVIADGARLLNGPEVVGRSYIGEGCQVLGSIAVQSVELAGGRSYTWPDVDERGAVLKGYGVARGLRLGVGDVVNGHGDFATAPVERQLAYHPR
jgi:carbonic anhydrase/acetyltransferase-like protein (isoleucine patch superfamily)